MTTFFLRGTVGESCSPTGALKLLKDDCELATLRGAPTDLVLLTDEDADAALLRIFLALPLFFKERPEVENPLIMGAARMAASSASAASPRTCIRGQSR